VKTFLALYCFVLASCGSEQTDAGTQELLLNVKFPVSTEEETHSIKREIVEYVVSVDGKEIGHISSKDHISELFRNLPQDQILTVTIEAMGDTENILWQGTHEVDFTVAKPKDFWMEKR